MLHACMSFPNASVLKTKKYKQHYVLIMYCTCVYMYVCVYTYMSPLPQKWPRKWFRLMENGDLLYFDTDKVEI